MPVYHMHKSEREITGSNHIEQVIIKGKFLTLALCRDHEPYILTLNYGYDRETHTLYFHTAREGLKLEYIAANPVACGTIIEDHGYIEKLCSHAYRSVVFSGSIEIATSVDEKKAGLATIMNHLEPDPEPLKKRYLDDPTIFQNMVILKMKIDSITGKEGRVT